jgi:hypothetical protein
MASAANTAGEDTRHVTMAANTVNNLLTNLPNIFVDLLSYLVFSLTHNIKKHLGEKKCGTAH